MMMFVSSRVVPFLLVSSVGRHRIFFNVVLALTCIAAHGESASYYCMVKCMSTGSLCVVSWCDCAAIAKDRVFPLELRARKNLSLRPQQTSTWQPHQHHGGSPSISHAARGFLRHRNVANHAPSPIATFTDHFVYSSRLLGGAASAPRFHHYFAENVRLGRLCRLGR